MRLLKIGTRIIDADKIIGVEIGEDHLVVVFSTAAPERAVLARIADFRGADAVALQGWLERNADDITPQDQPSVDERSSVFDTSALFERKDES